MICSETLIVLITLEPEIHTTKYHDHRQILPAHDVAEHIHSQVCGHLPTTQITVNWFLNVYYLEEHI